jgi:photosystem II stability/assembly factor-like uncharacterized protein
MVSKSRTVAAGAVLVAGISLALAVGSNGGGRQDKVMAQSLPARTTMPGSLPYDWKSVQIVGGGFVSGIIPHPTAKGVMYARTDIGGAYRWNAKAGRWIALTDWVTGDNWTFTGIESMAPDPSDPNRVYMAAGTYTNDWSGNGAIFRSSDQGTTWQRTDMPFKMGGNEDGRSNGERLAVDPNASNILFFGSRTAGLWKSTDRAVTWKKADSFPAVATDDSTLTGTGQWERKVGIVFVQFVPKNGAKGKPTQTLYAGVSTRKTSLYRSQDGGATWAAVPGQPVGLRPSHAALSTDGSLYFSYGDQPGPNGITDGAVWKLNTATGAWSNVTPLKPADGDRFGYGGVTVDRQRPQTVMVSTIDRWAKKDDLFRSTDGGKTWKQIGPTAERDATLAPWLTWGRPKADLGHWMGDIEIDPFDSDRVSYVTGTGIWTSTDMTASDSGKPTHWVVGAQGIEECVVDDIVSPTGGAPLLSVVWDIDGFRHENLDASPKSGFFKPAHGHNTSLDVAELAPNIATRVYGGGTGGAYSEDNGVTWTEFATKPEGSSGSGTIAVSADGKTFVWTPGGNAGVTVYSRDRGATWKPSAGLPPKLRVTSDRTNPAKFYAVDGNSGALYASEDGGATFSSRATGLAKGGYLRTVPGQSAQLWLAGGDGLHRSSDDGRTFTKLPSVTQGRRIGFGKAAPGKSYPSVYLVGKINDVYGIYRSDDVGASWARINDDQHQYGSVNTITGDPRVFGRVYIASANRGILYADPRQTTIKIEMTDKYEFTDGNWYAAGGAATTAQAYEIPPRPV